MSYFVQMFIIVFQAFQILQISYFFTFFNLFNFKALNSAPRKFWNLRKFCLGAAQASECHLDIAATGWLTEARHQALARG